MDRMDTVIESRGIGFCLQDVKVLFSRDVALNVAGMEIEGKKGEILIFPRWVAQILEEGEHATIQEQDMVVELKQALVKEDAQGMYSLSTLDDHFYIRLHSYMKKLDVRDRDNVGSMLNSLMRKRRKKIVHLADSTKLTTDILGKLTVEEQEFYDMLYRTSQTFGKRIAGGYSK